MISTTSVSSRLATPGGPARTPFALDVQYYLMQDPRQLPSHYLYDALGSCLFEAICRLPWYPVTRAEMRLLASHGAEIFAAAGPLARIVELGCGSGEKIATLLDRRSLTSRAIDLHLIDVSATALLQSSRAIDGIDGVRIVTHKATYEAGLSEIAGFDERHGRTLVLFLGSNIGNFDPPGADAFLRAIRRALRPGDLFLLGADLVKPASVLQLAYDDPLNVTAAFNRNLLVRINRELGGDFDLGGFAHAARWNAGASRVEMHLVSLRRQAVRIPAVDLAFRLNEGESIWTESSYKYEPAQISAFVERAGFSVDAQWIDTPDQFALTLAEAV